MYYVLPSLMYNAQLVAKDQNGREIFCIYAKFNLTGDSSPHMGQRDTISHEMIRKYNV